MPHRPLRGGSLRSASHDPQRQVLEIEFVDGTVIRYQGVPEEVVRRLFAAPNAATFWEDRIAEEYPSQRGRATSNETARARLEDLFKSDTP